MAEDYYKLLGVSKNASQDEIQKAYLKLVRKYHPDMNPDDPEGAKKKFQELQQAFETLKDPEKRKQYDQFGEGYEKFAGANGSGFNGFSGFSGGFSGGPGGFHQANVNLDDILNAFRGGMGAGNGSPFGSGFSFTENMGRGGRARRKPAGPVKGANTVSSVVIPLRLAVLGGKLPLAVHDPQTGKTKNVDVTIPVGIESGKKIKLRGMGEPSPNGGQNGDLVVTVTVAPHPYYSREGNDLYLRTPVTLKEAALGGKIDVPTPHGVVGVKIPAGSTTGTKLRLKGFGVRPGKGSADGNLYVVFDVALPKKWSSEDLALLEKMKLDDVDPRQNLTL